MGRDVRKGGGDDEAAKSFQKLLGDVGAWAMNIVSSVGIILVNKQLMSNYHFTFATTLTAMHFSMTGLMGLISQSLGYVTSKHVPFFDLLWFSLIANTSIVGMNVSLMLNSVGFYQIAKLSMIPATCLFEHLLHGKTFNREVKGSILLVLMGVGICTVTDFHVRMGGFFAAVIAVVSTSLQQIFIGALQKKHSVTPSELLSKTAPLQACSLLLLGPFVDYLLVGTKITDYQGEFSAFAFILLSCALAIFCNLSQYLCIGRFSAVSFQVIGHMKTVLVLLMGWTLFDTQITMKNVCGVLLAIVGMICYGKATERAKHPPMDMASSPGKKGELGLLLSTGGEHGKDGPGILNGSSAYDGDDEEMGYRTKGRRENED
ncbi:hypothetical protein CBR_g12762 [Chara braunii]|uniref:Sugar phosphate transporter domain-containing protein n=1 Tax=Chara braunii TaxID=69332 RepID=A0A388KSK8_CHABU|nr:hypothetical protein CBR_g12762 [Chara braunii]|eukprot:GBG73044.1 hypothetical protein CBR_g12762 [Chara braunii]